MLKLTAKITGFLVTQFGKRCISKLSTDKNVLELIKKQINIENTLAIEALEGRWSRRKVPFRKLTSDEIQDFPDLTEDDLKIFLQEHKCNLAI